MRGGPPGLDLPDPFEPIGDGRFARNPNDVDDFIDPCPPPGRYYEQHPHHGTRHEGSYRPSRARRAPSLPPWHTESPNTRRRAAEARSYRERARSPSPASKKLREEQLSDPTFRANFVNPLTPDHVRLRDDPNWRALFDGIDDPLPPKNISRIKKRANRSRSVHFDNGPPRVSDDPREYRGFW